LRRLFVFSAEWCQVCKALERSGIIEKFASEVWTPAKPLRIERHILENKVGRIIDRRGDTLFKRFGLRALPALVFVDGANEVLAKHEGGITLAGLHKLYERALKT